MKNFLEIGKIAKTHGLKGMMKARSFLYGKTAIKPGDEIMVVQDGNSSSWRLEYIAIKKGHFLLKLAGLEGIEAAQKLIGATLWISRDRLEPLEEDEYYWIDIIGLEVLDETGQSRGKVEEIFSTGSNDVYVCRNSHTELLLPAIGEVVKEIDLAKGLMRVCLPKNITAL